MSFSGEYQILCEDGHESIEDCFYVDYIKGFDKNWKCDICGGGMSWWMLLNHTNEYTEPLKLEVLDEAEFCTCKECGNRHITKHTRYKVPENKGWKVKKDVD
jgi:hypothetical protein